MAVNAQKEQIQIEKMETARNLRRTTFDFEKENILTKQLLSSKKIQLETYQQFNKELKSKVAAMKKQVESQKDVIILKSTEIVRLKMKNDDIKAKAKALNEQLEASTTENSQLKAKITGLSKMDLSEVVSICADKTISEGETIQSLNLELDNTDRQKIQSY